MIGVTPWKLSFSEGERASPARNRPTGERRRPDAAGVDSIAIEAGRVLTRPSWRDSGGRRTKAEHRLIFPTGSDGQQDSFAPMNNLSRHFNR